MYPASSERDCEVWSNVSEVFAVSEILASDMQFFKKLQKSKKILKYFLTLAQESGKIPTSIKCDEENK